MSLFNFNAEELMSFFAVLIRMSTLIVVLPFFGDKVVPASLKILLSFAISICVFPALVAQGLIHPGAAAAWSQTTGGLIGTIAVEAAFGLAIGYAAKLTFDGLHMGADIIGTMMGLGSASQYDPFMETQTQVVSQFQMALATLLFLVLDGHHIILEAMVNSYRIVGIGDAHMFSAGLSERLIAVSGDCLKTALQVAAPMVVTSFGINIIYAILAKALPQMNILVISFSISAVVGLFIMFLSLGQFHDVASGAFSKLETNLSDVMHGIAGK